MNHSIPTDINSLDRLSAVQFYAGTLGWAIHPLLAPDRGDHHERGKKPLLKGWRNHTAAEITPDFLTKYFGTGSNHNIGCVVRPPFVHVDLDSKPDAGASVMAWLATQSDLATVPRERTGGGAHLAFICRDIPEVVMKAKKAPTCQINDKVSAELYLDGLNLVLSPSVHKSGHLYSWEVTGDIPEVSWVQLCRWFGFSAPEAKKRGRPGKEKPWWSKWEQDLRTLDLAGVMEDLNRLGECLDPDHNKWSVRCPWEADHTGGVAETPGSDTIIFNQPETMPGFKCLHSHCESHGIKDLIEWAEVQKPGIITSRCANLRAWSPGTTNATGRPRIILPALGRSNSEFGKELGGYIAPALDLFRFSSNVVEIATVPAADNKGAIPGHMISTIRPTELVTAVERTVETGVLREDDAGDEVFIPKSMSEADARITLVSGVFTDALPRIRRVLDVPVPHFSDDGKIIYPNPGYDERFGTWLNPHAPKLKTMGHSEALRWLLNDLFGLPEHGGFWWHDEQARVHALARFITPFCRGLMGWKRTPLWIFDGNREGCGKDTCADLTHVAYTGRSIVCAPLSKECDDEMRKRITSALMAGSRFFHLANMKGHVRYASLEAATDNSGVWEDRRLGVSVTRRSFLSRRTTRRGNRTSNVVAEESACASPPRKSTATATATPTSKAGCASTARSFFRQWPPWSTSGCGKAARQVHRHSPRSRNGGRWWVASSTAPGCLTRVCPTRTASHRAINQPVRCGNSTNSPSIISVTLSSENRISSSSSIRQRRFTSSLIGSTSRRGRVKPGSESSSSSLISVNWEGSPSASSSLQRTVLITDFLRKVKESFPHVPKRPLLS